LLEIRGGSPADFVFKKTIYNNLPMQKLKIVAQNTKEAFYFVGNCAQLAKKVFFFMF